MINENYWQKIKLSSFLSFQCFIVAALMTLSIANAAVILQPGQYPFAQYPAGAARVYYSDPPVQFTGPRA